MRFAPHILDEIRQRLTLSDIVGRRVTYDRRKSQPQKGDFWACCPFHNEKTPSFHVDDRRNIYHCFGCGATGDHFKFLTEKEGLSFPEAVERLADEAGVELPKADPRAVEQEKKRATLYDVMALANQFFQQSMHEAAGSAARGYVAGRGLASDTQKRFGMGYAPSTRNALKEFLASKGVEVQQMIEAGLVNGGGDIPVPYDKFRDRVMFPILDLRERVIGFGGRAMSSDVPAKYLNSPETPLFSKRNILYNAARARSISRDTGRVIVVEGYMDVIALAQAGIHEAVAPLGTALTEAQIQLLWKMTDEPILCFDGDSAGLRAAKKSVDTILPLLPVGKSARFAFLPDGKDPDDLVRDEGVAAFEKVLEAAMPLHEFVMMRHLADADISTPERKAAIEKAIFADIALIPDQTVAHHYRSSARLRLVQLFAGNDGQQRERTGGAPSANRVVAPSFTKRRVSIGAEEIDRILIGLLVEYPSLIDENVEELTNFSFDNKAFGGFVDELYRLYVEYADLTLTEVYAQVGEGFYRVLNEVHGDPIRFPKTGDEMRIIATERGYRLYNLFPRLKLEPSEKLIGQTFELYLKKAYLRALQFEMDNLLGSPDGAEQAFLLIEERTRQSVEITQLEEVVDQAYQQLAAANGHVNHSAA